MKFREKYKKEIEIYDKFAENEVFYDIVVLGLVAWICDDLYDDEVRNRMLEVIDECREHLLNKEVE